MSYPCNIIQDLLPSYVDGLCSAESQRAVEEHVRGCEPCRQTLDAMQAKEYELPDPAQNIKKKRPFQKLRNRVLSLIMAVVLVCGSVSVFFHYNQNFYYQYLHWGDRIHINLTVNGIDASVPVDDCVQVSYVYIGENPAVKQSIREMFKWNAYSAVDSNNTYLYSWIPITLTRTGENTFTSSFPGGEKGYYMIRVDLKPEIFGYVFPDVPNLDEDWNGGSNVYDILNRDGWETWDYEFVVGVSYFEGNCTTEMSDRFTCHSSVGVYTSTWVHSAKG